MTDAEVQVCIVKLLVSLRKGVHESIEFFDALLAASNSES
jgi:hypothetical protein